MKRIEEIRSFFPRSANEEDKVILLIKSLLEEIDSNKNGTLIGRKRKVDYEELMQSSSFPAHIGSESDAVKKMIELHEGTWIWNHPQVQANVVPPATTVSIASDTLSARYNENSISDHYGISAALSEIIAVGMLCDLIGYDISKGGGIFTFGGTGGNLYAGRIGIEKADPDAKYRGIRDPIHFFCSDVSHYSIKTVALWTGVGLDNVKTIPSYDNVMDIQALKKEIEESIRTGARIGTIFATMGTTDAFGIDPLKEIIELRDSIEKKVGYRIHVHADAVIGWPYLTFRRDDSIKHLPHPLQEEIMKIVSGISELQYADSVSVDFHKTGWASYICSAIIVKDKQDLLMLQKQKKDMPYLFHGTEYQPGTFTLETSRPNYAQKAMLNMMLLGKEGYETLITHLITVADYLRDKMEQSPDIELLNQHNPAFVTDFRIYPQTKHDYDGDSVFERELHDAAGEKFTGQVNEYNQRIAQMMDRMAEERGTSLISYTDNYKTTVKKRTIVALKSYPMSPFTDKENMDKLIEDLYEAKKCVDREYEEMGIRI